MSPKKPLRPKKPLKARTPHRAVNGQAKPGKLSPAEDLELRKKISQTLDVDAFDEFHRKNADSAEDWKMPQ
jgi:hypothetical protein